jgi:hypothetical protein
MSRPVIVEVAIAAPADVVWSAMRDPAEIRRWFGWDYEGLDDEITFIFVEQVTASDADRTLDVGDGEIALDARGDSTVVRLRRDGPADEEINAGWLTFFQQLRFYLERHRGRERRTRLGDAPEGGEPWFSDDHQSGTVLGDGTLVIRTPQRTIVSAYH